MSIPQWIPQHSVIGRLLRAPQRFEFVQAVWLLNGWLGAADPDRVTPKIRFRNRISLSFAPSEIEDMQVQVNAEFAGAKDEIRSVTITPAVLSLLGSTGDLPYASTCRVMATQQQGRIEGVRGFFDMLSQRSVELYYQARSHARIHRLTGLDGRELLLTTQLAVAGVRPGSIRKHESDTQARMPDEVPAYYAAILQQHFTSAVTMQNVLSDYFGVPFEIVQFLPDLYRLPPEEQTVLGVRKCVLGKTAILGPRVPNFQRQIRLCIGPLTRQQYEHFMPGAPGGKAVAAFMPLFKLANLKVTVQLFLKHEETCQARLKKTKLGFGYHLGPTPVGPSYGAKRYALALG